MRILELVGYTHPLNCDCQVCKANDMAWHRQNQEDEAMTMPHLMNCDHSDDGWCLACVKDLWQSHQGIANESIDHGTDAFILREAIQSARIAARSNGITTRQFAAWCGVSPTQLSRWTDNTPLGEPDFID